MKAADGFAPSLLLARRVCGLDGVHSRLVQPAILVHALLQLVVHVLDGFVELLQRCARALFELFNAVGDLVLQVGCTGTQPQVHFH